MHDHDPLDLIQGCAAIGRLFDPPLNSRQVQYLASTIPGFPVFKFNGRQCTTRSSMQGYFARLASEAMARVPTLASENPAVAEEPRAAAPLKQRIPTRRKPAKRRGGGHAP